MERAMSNGVVGKLGQYSQASIALNFKKELEWLSDKLRSLRSYLREVDLHSAQNGHAKTWLLDIAEIALDAEDILDECAVESQGTKYESPQLSCLFGFIHYQLLFRFKMARRIKDVKDRLRSSMETAAEMKLFHDLIHSGQPSTSTSGNVKWKRMGLMERDSRPVVIEPKVNEILRLLDDPANPVIALVGMGGVGKTFLLQNLFDRVKDNFQNSIWLDISQTYSLRELQADLASKIKLIEVVKGLSDMQATELIHEHLSRTRSLIVLDDLWRASEEYNLISSLGLPRGKNSNCKILISTRSKFVCRNMNACIYEVGTLSEEESWTLFCAFAFPDRQQNQPPEQLEGIARQIEAECGRLALAVKTVAASLAGKNSSTVWESKLGLLKAPSYTKDPIMQSLKLSYDSLPVHLKPCFAFLSFFPENEEIDPHYLIPLWVAEGYVPQGDGDEDQLDIGLSYIYHLYNLCMIERTGDIYDQVDKRFKLNDLMVDLAISISKESKCAFTVEETFSRDPSMQTSNRHRRILLGKKSIGDYDVEIMARNSGYSASCLRTLSFSQDKGIQTIPAILLCDARVLRILDLSGTNISSLPICVGNLKLLRVLNLRRTQITKVPKCIRGNKSLRYLDISSCQSLQKLPEWIGELSCLEHLDVSGIDGIPKGISNLVSLHILRSDCKLSVEKKEFFQLEDFAHLINLREVSMVVHHETELKTMEKRWILPMSVKMRSLKICNESEGRVDACNLPPLSKDMLAVKYLEFLWLDSFAVPNWISGFSNMMQLKLCNCHCAEYPALELMPNLIKLELNYNATCKALPKGFGKRRGFPQLHVFKILNFPVLEELAGLEDGAMPHLEILKVSQCPNLKKVPSGLGLLKCLKECKFIMTGISSISSTLAEGGEVWNKVKANNPNAIICLD